MSKSTSEQKRAWELKNPERNAMNRLRARARAMGLDADTIEQRFLSHSGRCDICGRLPEAASPRRKLLCMDHDHRTGKFRGFICNSCNVLLGHCGDRIDILETAIQYLVNSSQEDD